MSETPALAYPGVIHMHSDYSHDGLDPLDALRDTCVERGIRFVGMTDHAEDFLPEVFAEYVQHCAALSDDRVQFIPGLEFRFAGLRGLHLFALGLREWIAPDTPTAFFDATRDTAQMTVLAHPVLAHYQIPNVVLDRVDAIEVWNGNYNTRYLPDPRSIDIMRTLRRRRPAVVATVGLDQHDRRNDRELRVVLDAPTADPIAALKAGAFTNVGRTMRFDAHATMSTGQFRRLQIMRRMFDATDRVHHRVVETLRRLGLHE